MRISTKLLHFFSALAISGAASASDFQGELQDQSRSIVEKTLSGMGRAKNSGQTWLNWTKYERGDRSVYASLMADAEAGSPDAMNVLGHILVEGVGRPQNIQEGVRWLQSAATALPLAKYNLGLLYLQGRGVAQNEARAVELFQEALAKERIQQAMVRLLLHYAKVGDRAKTWEWAQKAAEARNKVGIYYVGRMLMDGTGPRKDPGAALRWLTQAAEMFSPEAAGLLSDLYRHGLGVDRNEAMSAGWRMISTGMAKSGAGRIAVSVGGLSQGDTERAQRFASDWLATHRPPKPVEYEKTLPLLGR